MLREFQASSLTILKYLLIKILFYWNFLSSLYGGIIISYGFGLSNLGFVHSRLLNMS